MHIGELIIFTAWGWFLWFTYVTVIQSRLKGLARVKQLRRDGFQVDYMLKGNVYVLCDHRRRKIAFVFKDSSSIHDYSDIKSLTWYWVNYPIGPRLKNCLVFTLKDRMIKCGRLSARQAEHWQAKLSALMKHGTHLSQGGE